MASWEKDAGPWSRALLPAALSLGLGAPAQAPAQQPVQPPAHVQQQPSQNQKLEDLVVAIGRAEGAKPYRHNPGNIADNEGKIRTFKSDAEGKAALVNQLKEISSGTHKHIKPHHTLEQAGLIYSNGDPNWAHNVSSILGVPKTIKMKDLIDGRYVAKPHKKKHGAEAAPMSLAQALEALRPQLAAVAQKVYDENVAANVEDPDMEHGICDEIASELQGVIVSHIADVEVTEGGQDGDDHAWVIAYRGREVYGVDIAPSVYESGGGYSWKLHENVTIQPTDVDIFKLDITPEDLHTGSMKEAKKDIIDPEDLDMDENEKILISEQWKPTDAGKQLYHGTSSLYLEQIKSKGLRAGTYVTNSWYTAKDEAFGTVHFDVNGKPGVGGDPIVVFLNPVAMQGPLMPDPEYIRGAIEERGDIYAWKSVKRILPSAIVKIEQRMPRGKDPAVQDDWKKVAAAPLTKELLERIAWEVRDEIAPHGDSAGTCQEVSEGIVDKLHAMGYPAAHVVFGQFLGHPQHPHTWVSAYDWEIDATQDQFANTNAFEHMETELADNPVYVGPHRKHASVKKIALRIEVPKSTRDHFWEEPPEGNLEFWAFRHHVNILPGEKIVFTFDGAPIARTVCHHIEEPGQSECETTGKYKNHHKVYWDPKKFVRLDGKTGAKYLFHGTAFKNIEAIKQRGLVDEEGVGENKGIYLTQKLDDAKYFGEAYADDESRFAIAVVDPSKCKNVRVGVKPEDLADESQGGTVNPHKYMLADEVPPAAIVRVDAYDMEGKMTPGKPRREEWMRFQTLEEAKAKLNKAPSQPFYVGEDQYLAQKGQFYKHVPGKGMMWEWKKIAADDYDDYELVSLEQWRVEAPKIWYHASDAPELPNGLTIGHQPEERERMGRDDRIYLTDLEENAHNFSWSNDPYIYEIIGLDPNALEPDPEVLPGEIDGPPVKGGYIAVMYAKNIPAQNIKRVV